MAEICTSGSYAKTVFDVRRRKNDESREYTPEFADTRENSPLITEINPLTPNYGKHTRPLFTPIGVGVDIHGYSISEHIFQE